MRCGRRGCETTEGVERFAPHLFLCALHRAMILGAAREVERILAQRTKEREVEAHQVAVQSCGWVSPPKYKLTQRFTVVEFSGGLPSLGKGQ